MQCTPFPQSTFTRFLSDPLIIRVPFFLLCGVSKETPNQKGQNGTTGEPSSGVLGLGSLGYRGLGSQMQKSAACTAPYSILSPPFLSLSLSLSPSLSLSIYE